MTAFIIVLFNMIINFIFNDAGYYCSQISYPVFEYHSCSFSHGRNQVEGECKRFAECPVAIQLWKNAGINPMTCWYNGLDHVVCCPQKLPSLLTKETSIEPDSIDINSDIRKISTLNRSPSSTLNKPIFSEPGKFGSQTILPSETDILSTTTTQSPFTIPPNLRIGEKCVSPDSSINGTCQKWLECPSAMKMWRTQKRYPKQCFHDIVCCMENDSQLMKLQRSSGLRKNEIHCNSIYGITFGGVPTAGGIPAKPREFPYMVVLGWNSELDKRTSFRCGGVLIADTFVLTAAHCVTSRGDPPVRVKIGGDNLTDTTFREVNIVQILVHPEYDSEKRKNDIALIRLEIKIPIEMACLWNDRDLELDNLTAIGYGNTRFAGPSSDQLIKAFLFFVPTSECQDSYDEELLDSHICAGKSRNDTCQGDSGGPLLMYRESKFYPFVVGITSFGQPCGGDTPGVYTRVSEFIDWIESIVWA